MVYAYAALKEGIPYANAAPNLTADIPAMIDLAHERRICRWPGKDLKTGQTLIKTIIAPGLKARLLGVAGWYSTNILGNRDGEVLDDPESFKTKEESKKSVLDYILQPHLYPELYERPLPRRADQLLPAARRQQGRLGQHRSRRAGSATRCSSRSTSSAATASWPRRSCSTSRCSSTSRTRAGMAGIQEWLSFYFKSPMHAPGPLPGARPVHPADEAQEHAALPEGRGADHAPRAGVPTTSRTMGNRLQPALLGGLVLGVLSALPIISAGNICCCLWVVTGGAVAAWVLQANQPSRITPGDGATVGALAGLVGSVVWLVLSIPIGLMMGPIQARLMERVLERTDTMPERMGPLFETIRDNAGFSVFGTLLGFVVMLLVGVIFATVGGAIGAALFGKSEIAAPPPLPPDFRAPDEP